MNYCINFDFETGVFDGTGNQGCIDKFHAFSNAMMEADGWGDGNGAVSLDECNNITDEDMYNACIMASSWCDYNYDGQLEWCEFMRCAYDAEEWYGCSATCDIDPANDPWLYEA